MLVEKKTYLVDTECWKTVRFSTSLRRKGPTSRPSWALANGFFGGSREFGTSCRTLNFQEETGNLKKKRLRIHEDSVMSCERFVRKLLLFAYCHLMTQWPSLLRFLWLLLLLLSGKHEELFTRWHGRALWGFTRKIKIFVGSIVRISSNPRNFRIVNFKEAHDELVWSFFGVWFKRPSPQCRPKQLQMRFTWLHDCFCKSRIQYWYTYVWILIMLKKCKLTIWYDEHREIHQYEPMTHYQGPSSCSCHMLGLATKCLFVRQWWDSSRQAAPKVLHQQRPVAALLMIDKPPKFWKIMEVTFALAPSSLSLLW